MRGRKSRLASSHGSMLCAANEYQERVLEGVAIWASYYRANVNRFVQDYIHVSLKLFQAILLVLMNISTVFVFIASRGMGKSFLCAIYCCVRAILYPGTKICIASGTRGQSVNVLEKIMTELVPNSVELSNEIDFTQTKLSPDSAKIQFKNSSFIKVVTAGDSARSNRANVLILDEFRMIKKDVIDTILSKFLSTPRHPRYLDDPQYAHLKETNKTVYLSSAFYKDHWSYTKCKDICRMMLDESRHGFVCGFPYQLALDEDLLMEDTVLDQMMDTDFNEITWSMEMESLWYGASADAFYNYDAIAQTRKLNYAMLPGRLSRKLPSATECKIPPKLPGEIRTLSADIALMASTKFKNDATALFINQMLPTKAGRYSSNIVYTESNEGLHTEDEALVIRKMFDEFECDYLVLDVRNVGLSIFDLLARDMSDPDTGEIYPALSCCNNKDIAARCTVPNAPKVVWAITGSAKLNSDCAVLLREGFRSGRIRLLASEYDAEDVFGECKGFKSLSAADKTALLLPYINTSLLINELVNLQYEENGQVVKLKEKPGARKDRYSSLSYNYYVALQLEREARKRFTFDEETNTIPFIHRKPKSFTSMGSRL